VPLAIAKFFLTQFKIAKAIVNIAPSFSAYAIKCATGIEMALEWYDRQYQLQQFLGFFI